VFLNKTIYEVNTLIY